MLNEGAELTEGQRSDLIRLIDDKMEAKQCDNALSEFHKWIRQGDSILADVEKELSQLRALTSADGDTISKAAVMDILGNLYIKHPKSDQNLGVNWALDKVAEAIEKLHTA